MIVLEDYLILAAALFCLGLYCALVKKNVVGILMGIEIMLNAVNINLAAFNRFIAPQNLVGHLFVVFITVVAAAELSVGLAIVLSIYRYHKTSSADDLDWLKW